MIAKIQPCLWFDGNAEEAARFYADTFPDSRIGVVMRAPGDYPSGKKGDVLTVDMTILGMPFLLLNGGPEFQFDEAVSFQVATEDQAETDRYWDAIIARGGGKESACGWCKDRFGLSWQITPKRLTELITQGGETAARAFTAMMDMRRSTSRRSIVRSRVVKQGIDAQAQIDLLNARFAVVGARPRASCRNSRSTCARSASPSCGTATARRTAAARTPRAHGCATDAK